MNIYSCFHGFFYFCEIFYVNEAEKHCSESLYLRHFNSDFHVLADITRETV